MPETLVRRRFPNIHFRAETIHEAWAQVRDHIVGDGDPSWLNVPSEKRSVTLGDETWNYTSDERFDDAYSRGHEHAECMMYGKLRDPDHPQQWDSNGFVAARGIEVQLSVTSNELDTVVSVGADTDEQVLAGLNVFTRAIERGEVTALEPVAPDSGPRNGTVFIGHGRSAEWRKLHFELQNWGLNARVFESGFRGGLTVRDVVSEELHSAGMAVLVMTAEDEQADGAMRARQNVIHEAGLFQGRLGWNRSVLLIERGVEKFSNESGVVHIEFEHGRIETVMGDLLGVLKREGLLP